jgi:hypothetical protein
MTGLYVSTTTAGNWQDRVVARALLAATPGGDVNPEHGATPNVNGASS